MTDGWLAVGWFLLLALTVAAFAVMMYARAKRRPERLDYRWRAPDTGWHGSSLDAWRHRCDASLEASRRRRGVA